MRPSVIFIVTVLLMGCLTAALLFKQRHQTERLAGLEHQVSELQSKLQARESLIEDLLANQDLRSQDAPMFSWEQSQVEHLLGEIAQRQSNMMSMLETALRSPTSVVFPGKNPERVHREMLRLDQMHEEEVAKMHEFRIHVQELAEQLGVSDEIGQMDPSTGLDTVSLRAFWSYFEAKKRLNAQERVVETMKLRALQARIDLQAIGDGEIP